jgi:murein L,D-transpeptidase YcbB/YkuD
VPATKKLRMGVSEPEVRLLRQRLIASGDLDRNAGLSNAFDSYVDGAVKKFQARHGLPPDGVLGNYSYQALNVSADVRLGQLETNLVRLRSMSGFLGDRYVMVNIPAAEIEAVENGRVLQNHKAIVGKIDRQTPILNSKIHEVILNPYWTAPRSIIEKDIIPLMRKDPTYLTRNSIRLFDQQGQRSAAGTGRLVDEKAPEPDVPPGSGQDQRHVLDQDQLPQSACRLHARHAAAAACSGQLMRFESSGCVRVQNVRDLNTWLLRDTPGWNRQPDRGDDRIR